MAALTPLSMADAKALFAAYDLGQASDEKDVTDVATVTAGTVNSSYAVRFGETRRFVRIYEEQDHEGARTEAARLELLAGRGVRTPAPMRRRCR